MVRQEARFDSTVSKLRKRDLKTHRSGRFDPDDSGLARFRVLDLTGLSDNLTAMADDSSWGSAAGGQAEKESGSGDGGVFMASGDG